jgi:hypothetical protein
VGGAWRSPDATPHRTARRARLSTSGEIPPSSDADRPEARRLPPIIVVAFAAAGADCAVHGRAARDSTVAPSTLISFLLNLLTPWNYWKWNLIIKCR